MSALPEADRRFLEAFERCELSEREFRHREHVRLAYIYLRVHDAEAALDLLRTGLRRFLAHLGAPASVYHETLTHAWLLAVAHFMHRTGPTADFEQFAQAASRLFDKDVMHAHYTPELLMSDAARSGFVAPDRDPIPRHAAGFN